MFIYRWMTFKHPAAITGESQEPLRLYFLYIVVDIVVDIVDVGIAFFFGDDLHDFDDIPRKQTFARARSEHIRQSADADGTSLQRGLLVVIVIIAVVVAVVTLCLLCHGDGHTPEGQLHVADVPEVATQDVQLLFAAKAEMNVRVDRTHPLGNLPIKDTVKYHKYHYQ